MQGSSWTYYRIDQEPVSEHRRHCQHGAQRQLQQQQQQPHEKPRRRRQPPRLLPPTNPETHKTSECHTSPSSPSSSSSSSSSPPDVTMRRQRRDSDSCRIHRPEAGTNSTGRNSEVMSKVSNVCDMPVTPASDLLGASSSWRQRRMAARTAHLEVFAVPRCVGFWLVPGAGEATLVPMVEAPEKPKSRLTAQVYEQWLNSSTETPEPATLRTLMLIVYVLGLRVSFGNCTEVFLQAPIQETREVWVTPELRMESLGDLRRPSWVEGRTSCVGSLRCPNHEPRLEPTTFQNGSTRQW